MWPQQIMRIILSTAIVILMGGVAPASAAEPYKVLVVMSYEEDFAWAADVRAGIESVLANRADLRFFYLETKKNFAGGAQKAAEAYALYQEFQPDGVITADDDAQAFFVVPYLKDKVKTPVMFCGVNSEATQYGYPASNVSGILERYHLQETLTFARQLMPTLTTVGFITKESPTGDAFYQQIQQEAATYPVKVGGFKAVQTLKEGLAAITEMQQTCDAVVLEALQGIPDENGTPMLEEEIFPALERAFGKPTFALNTAPISSGTLCTVAKIGQEHGEVAANMLLQAMAGTPVADLPITVNKKGKRMLNVDTMKALGILPKPHVLTGVELVRTSK